MLHEKITILLGERFTFSTVTWLRGSCIEIKEKGQVMPKLSELSRKLPKEVHIVMQEGEPIIVEPEGYVSYQTGKEVGIYTLAETGHIHHAVALIRPTQPQESVGVSGPAKAIKAPSVPAGAKKPKPSKTKPIGPEKNKRGY